MNFTEILLTGFSLSLDAVAVSIAAGALNHRLSFRDTFKVSFSFGFFQTIMPLLGLFTGSVFTNALSRYGSVVGFLALASIGLKMLREAWHKPDRQEIDQEKHIANWRVLLAVSIATSIDALVIGVTFNFMKVNVALAVATIGLVTLALCLFGVYIGKKGRNVYGNKVEILGAIILIILAFKVLLF